MRANLKIGGTVDSRKGVPRTVGAATGASESDDLRGRTEAAAEHACRRGVERGEGGGGRKGRGKALCPGKWGGEDTNITGVEVGFFMIRCNLLEITALWSKNGQ